MSATASPLDTSALAWHPSTMDAWGLNPDGEYSSEESASDAGRSDGSLDVPGAECLLAPSSLGANANAVGTPRFTSGGRPPLTLKQRIWVGGVLALITTLCATSEALIWQYFYTAHIEGLYPLHSALLHSIGPLSIGIIALYASYLSCVLSDPGRVDARGWTPPVAAFPDVVSALAGLPGVAEHQESAEAGDEADASEASSPGTLPSTGALVLAQRRQLYRLLRAGGARWCTRCRWFQPPRAHHCRVCGVCVARMDHHCPWLGNCVGARNYGDFLRFLFAVDVCISFELYLESKVALDSWRIRRGPPSSFVMSVLLGNMVFSTLVLLLVGGFSLYMFFLTMANQTSIESSETSRASTLARRGRITSTDAQYPFSLGAIDNLLATLGPRPWLWFLPALTTKPAPMPVPPPPPDHIPYALRTVLPQTQEQATRAAAADRPGWSYPTAYDPLAQYRWPPRDPLRVMEQQYRREHLAREAQAARAPPGELMRSSSSIGTDPELSETSDDEADEDVPLANLHKGALTLRRRKPAAPITAGPAPSRANTGPWKGDGSSTASSPMPAHGVMDRPEVGRVRMRRGSEGFEVRPVHYGTQLPTAPWANSDPLAGEPQPRGTRPPPLLPSEVLERRATAAPVP